MQGKLDWVLLSFHFLRCRSYFFSLLISLMRSLFILDGWMARNSCCSDNSLLAIKPIYKFVVTVVLQSRIDHVWSRLQFKSRWNANSFHVIYFKKCWLHKNLFATIRLRNSIQKSCYLFNNGRPPQNLINLLKSKIMNHKCVYTN